MNGSVFQKPSAEPAFQGLKMSQEQQRDLADRERQAKSLAAAGLVAETVGRSQGNGHLQGLHHPPPALAASGPTSPRNAVMDSTHWGMPDVDDCLQDMEMDFAMLFDPAHELESMQIQGSGWPWTGMSDSAAAAAPPPPPPGTEHSSDDKMS
jgi:hypothetical protein